MKAPLLTMCSGCNGGERIPDILQQCDLCKGTGIISKDGSIVDSLALRSPDNVISCPQCRHSLVCGTVAIIYTPDAWEIAGGVLSDELPIWFRLIPSRRIFSSDAKWNLSTWGEFKECVDSNEIIIATPYITTIDLEGLDGEKDGM
jgi:hypothetical protein